MKINEAVLADLCALSYLDPADLPGRVTDAFDSIQPFQNSGAEAIVCCAGQTAIVAVRGTQKGWLDLLRDTQFLFPLKQPVGRVHRGFRRSADKLLNAFLMPFLRECGFKEIWFCGHSLGGAVATVLARDAVNEFEAKINLFTIGQPRTGTADWASNVEQVIKGTGGRVERFVHPSDLVPRVPPAGRNILPDYRHVGQSKIIMGPTSIIDGDSQLESFLSTLFSLKKSPLSFISAHGSAKYVTDLESWCEFRAKNGMPTIIQGGANAPSTPQP